jgi:glycosyltransferase involved in cell wall biosynthesis
LVPAGAERSLAALAPHLVAHGIELDVGYLLDRAGLQEELTRAGATLFPLEGKGGRPGWVYRATRLAFARRPDLIHTTLFEADVAGRIAGGLSRTPVVSSLVNVAYGPEMLEDRNLRRWKVRGAQVLDGTTARLVRRFHAITRHVAETMSIRLRLPRGRIDIIPRGRDRTALGIRTASRRDQMRTTLGVGSSTSLLLAIGRHERQKGLDVLLEALPSVLQEHPETHLLIAGRDGNESTVLRDIAERLNLQDQVRFLGVRGDVADLLCAADAFVFPSRWEGQGGAILEAMALETPIVASDLPAVRESVGDEAAAWLVPKDRPIALADAVSAVISDRRESTRRARMALARFDAEFTIERIAERMVGFSRRAFDRLCGSARGRASSPITWHSRRPSSPPHGRERAARRRAARHRVPGP